jgi:hypothetical protein
VGWERQGEIAQLTLVCVVTGGLAGVVESEATEHGQEAGLGAPAVVDGVDPGAAEIANGFVSFIGHEDGNEFSGAVEAGEFDGVLFVGLDVVAGLGRDQRGGR